MNLICYLFFFILFQIILNFDYYTCSSVKTDHDCLPYDSSNLEDFETKKK